MALNTLKAQSLFITGTDTGVGKTYVACKLIAHFVAQGYKVVGMKPVAAGCDLVNGVWVNEDVALLTAASNIKAPAALVNPYCFKDPIAPHIAAAQEGVLIDSEVIKAAYHQLTLLADIVVVEGAGGLLVPLNSTQTIADLIIALDLPVILVVGMKLGCINHALLTMEAINTRKISLIHWIANPLKKKMSQYQSNVLEIQKRTNKLTNSQIN